MGGSRIKETARTQSSLGGVALRFARVLRHRPDKTAAEADTLETVLAVQSGVT